MSAAKDSLRFARLVQKLDPQGRFQRAWPLQGGLSAQVSALEYVRADGTRVRQIVRLHGPADRAENPNIAQDEYRLLQALHSAGLPVPAPVHVEPAGDVFPTPALVVAYVDGRPDFTPSDPKHAVAQLADALARLHQLDITTLDLPALPQRTRRFDAELRAQPALPNAHFHEAEIRAALAAVWPLPQTNATALLHGDYWPGNVLFREGQLMAVIDWEDAALGDPLADLANSRLEVLWALGAAAMHHFTQQYRLRLPGLDTTMLPYWDLCVALRPIVHYAAWAEDPATEARMREGLRLFVTQALKKFQTRID